MPIAKKKSELEKLYTARYDLDNIEEVPLSREESLAIIDTPYLEEISQSKLSDISN
jgi:hypothetical protein